MTLHSVGPKIQDFIKVSAYFPTKTDDDGPSSPKRIVADLPDRALSEFIKEVSAKEKDSKGIVSQLNERLGSSPPVVEEFIDLTRISRRLVVSVEDLLPGEYNRISKVKAIIKFPSDFRLLSCNRFETEYKTIDLGELNFSRSMEAKVSGNLGTGLTGTVGSSSNLKKTQSAGSDEFNTTGSEDANGTTKSTERTLSQGASAEAGITRALVEKVLLQQRLLVVSAMVENNRLALTQEGIAGIKLNGNVSADIVFDARKNVAVESTYDFSDLTDAADKFNSPDKLKLTSVLVAFPNYQSDLTVDIDFSAEYREIIKGDDTESESDDKIRLHYGTTNASRKVTLLAVDDFKPKFWMISASGVTPPIPEVNISSPAASGNGALLFNSFAMARSFLTWLKAHSLGSSPSSIKIGMAGHKLTLNSGSFTPGAVAKLQVSAF